MKRPVGRPRSDKTSDGKRRWFIRVDADVDDAMIEASRRARQSRDAFVQTAVEEKIARDKARNE